MTTDNATKKDYVIKDSGHRREFSTGAFRDVSKGKGRFDLLQMFSVIAQSIHLEKGRNKYGSRNWEQGIPASKYIDSGLRHIIKFFLGLTDEKHLDAAIWNFMCLKDTLVRVDLGLLPEDLNDLPYPLKDVDPEKVKEVLGDWIQ